VHIRLQVELEPLLRVLPRLEKLVLRLHWEHVPSNLTKQDTRVQRVQARQLNACSHALHLLARSAHHPDHAHALPGRVSAVPDSNAGIFFLLPSLPRLPLFLPKDYTLIITRRCHIIPEKS